MSLYGIVANETMTTFLNLAPKSKSNDDVNTFDRELDLSYLLEFSCNLSGKVHKMFKTPGKQGNK